MNWFLVPLLPSSPQTFQIALDARTYTLTFKWCDWPEGGWLMDIADAETDQPLAAGIPLVTGANLMSGLEYLGVGSGFVVYTNGEPDAVPTFGNLGVESNLYFLNEAV